MRFDRIAADPGGVVARFVASCLTVVLVGVPSAAYANDGDRGDPVRPDEPGQVIEEPLPEPSRGFYVRPDVRTAQAGDTRQFTAWFCDVPDGGSPFGADDKPLTEDDTCRKALKAVWSVSDDDAASLVTSKGPMVQVIAVASGNDVIVAASRADWQDSATLTILEPAEEPAVEPETEGAEPSDVEPAATVKVGPLLGTIGFRTAAPLPVRDPLTGLPSKRKGLYVTTHIKSTDGRFKSRAERLKARQAPNNLTVEMGLFRAKNGRFKLLGENGKWVARKDMVMQATASRWSVAWSFKAEKLEPKALPVCLRAYYKGKPKGLLKLNSISNPVLKVQGPPSRKCNAQNELALFLTDDIPAAAKATRLLYPKTAVDRMTRVRFTPPDRQVTLTTYQRDKAIRLIDNYFLKFSIYTNQLWGLEEAELDDVADPLAVADKFDPGPKPKKIDWFGLVFSAVQMALPMMKQIEDLKDAAEIALETVAATQAIVEFGVALSDTIPSTGPKGARIIEGVTTANVAKKSVLGNAIKAKWIRRTDNLQLMRVLLKQGCGKKTKACDRRLGQWLSKPPKWPDQDLLLMQQQVFASKVNFLKEILPLRGRLYAVPPHGWTHVSPETGDYDGPWHIRHWLGDAGEGTSWGFGRRQPSEVYQNYVLYTSVWEPWYHKSYDWSHWVWRERPKAFAWAIGLKGDDEDDVTRLQSATFDQLFQAHNPKHPLLGGMGLSYKEVACEWLTNTPYATYNKRSGEGGNSRKFNPCHFAFYDLSADQPLLRSNTARWIGPKDATDESTYRKTPNYSVALWTPDLIESQAGRDGDDPDIFSWIIPHLKWGPVKNNPGDYPKSAKKGTRKMVPVYFANLTQGSVTVHKVNPEGSSRIVSDALRTIPRWGAIDTRYAAKKRGPIPYDSQTVGIKRLESWVGATYLVRRVVPVEGEVDIGTYTVIKTPSGSAVCKNEPSDKCHVAEIHGHAGNHDGILDK